MQHYSIVSLDPSDGFGKRTQQASAEGSGPLAAQRAQSVPDKRPDIFPNWKRTDNPLFRSGEGCARFLIRLRVAVLNGPRLTAGPFKFAFRISRQFLSYFAGCPLTPEFQPKKEVYTLLLWTILIFSKAHSMAVVHCPLWTCLPVVNYQRLLMVVGTWAVHAQVQVAIGILCPQWPGPIQHPHRGPLAE